MLENGVEKILTADNDEEILIAFESALETAGYDTALALDAEEVFCMLSRTSLDLVVLDDRLSDDDCFAVLVRLRQTGHRPPAVVTYHRHPPHELEVQLRALGASAFVNKRAPAGLPHVARFLLRPRQRSDSEFRRTT